MLPISRESKLRIFIFSLIVLLAGAFRTITSVPFVQASLFLYCLFCVGCIMEIRKRIIQSSIRRLLVAMVVFMVLLFILRGFKHFFFNEIPEYQHYFWYAYSVPMSIIPLMSFFAAIIVDEPDPEAVIRKYIFLVPVWLCIPVLFLTNDLHHMVYSFDAAKSERMTNYSREAGYWICGAWIAFWFVASFAVLFIKCRRSSCRKYTWIPLGVLAIECIYFARFYFNGIYVPDIFGPHLFNPPEFFCIMLAAYWESNILIGLIPSCSGYDEIFRISNISALIYDDGEDLIASTVGSRYADRLDRAGAKHGSIQVKNDIFLSSRKINGGRVYWYEDRSEINSLNQELSTMAEYLDDENELIKEEIRLEENSIKNEIKNEVYDRLGEFLSGQIEKVVSLSALCRQDSERGREILKEIVVYGAYIKRRSNMALIAAYEPDMETGELKLSIAESLDYLRLRDIACSLICNDEENILGMRLPSEKLIYAYDYFEHIIEDSLKDMNAIIVRLNPEEKTFMRLEIGTEAGLMNAEYDAERLKKLNGSLSAEYTDETMYISLKFSGGGDGE